MRGGLAGRADGHGAFDAGEDGAVGGGAVGLRAVGGRAWFYGGDCSEVDVGGFGKELFEDLGR